MRAARKAARSRFFLRTPVQLDNGSLSTTGKILNNHVSLSIIMTTRRCNHVRDDDDLFFLDKLSRTWRVFAACALSIGCRVEGDWRRKEKEKGKRGRKNSEEIKIERDITKSAGKNNSAAIHSRRRRYRRRSSVKASARLTTARGITGF